MTYDEKKDVQNFTNHNKYTFGPIEINDVISISYTSSLFEIFKNNKLVNSFTHNLDLERAAVEFENNE